MMKRLFLIAAVILCSHFSCFNSLQAQRLNTAYTYTTGVDSTLWYDIDDIGENLIATGGARSQLISIGFPFRYDGTEYTQFSVNRFGMVRFGSDMVQTYISTANRPLGSEAGNYAPGVVVIGCNTTLDESSYVRVAPVGTPGSRVMVLEMYMKLYGTTAGRVKVQLQLFEGSNNMRLVYGPLEGNAPTSAYQIGFVPRSTDVALIKVSDNTLLYANTTSQTNASRTWPDAWRWYQISYDNSYCSLFTTPWSENFNTVDNLGCWTMLDYDGYSYSHWDRDYRASGDYSMWAWRNNYACNDWMVTPPIQLPADSDGLMLMYEFRADGDDGDCGEMEVRVAPYGTGDVPAVDTNDFDAPLWLDGIRSTSDFERRGLSLAAYAGQKVRIAFVHVRLHSNSNIYVDNVSVAQTTVPSVRIDAPHRAHAHEGTVVTAYLNEGSYNGLSYTWHSSLLDTTLVSTASTATITYTAAGSDTLTCIATNIHGADTTQVVIDVVDCSTVRRYPWKDDFEHGLDCWYQQGGWATTYSYGTYEGEMALRSNLERSYSYSGSRWIISQPFTIPALADTAMMELIWQMRTRSMYNYDYNQFNLRIATVTDDAVPAESAFTTVMSKEMHYGPWERYRYDLSAYAGQTIRFMFYNWPNNDGYEPFVLIDQVEVRSTREPVVMIEAPFITEDIDSVVYTAILDEGDTAGLTYTWHSTLLDTTIVTTATIVTITYNTVGVDTLTLIASNIWGSDTAVAVVQVRNCPVQTLPFVIDFEDNSALNCWSGFTCQYVSSTGEYVNISDETPWYIADDNTNHYLASNTDYGWIVSPAIDVPSDTADLYLSWDQLGGYIQVMVATGEDYTHESDFTQFQFINGTGHQRFSMAQYAGQRIHFAFVSNYSYYNHKIDNISLAYFDVTPVVTLSAPDTVRENQTVVVNATLNDCSHRDLTYTWHSTLLDTTIVTIAATATITYPSTGIDTLTLVVSNHYGADTQQAIIVVIGCSGLSAPYSEDFNSLTGANYNSANGVLPPCWNILWNGSLNNAPKVLTHNQSPFTSYNSNALILMASGNRDNNWDTVVYAILPSFADNLNTLALSLRHVHENVGQGTLTVGYMDAGTFVPLAYMPAVAGTGRVDTVSFISVPATATNIALRWLKNTQVWYSVLVDDVHVFVANPVGAPTTVRLDGPTTVVAFDDVTFTAQLQSGDTTGLTYTWHSTLLDTTIVTIAPITTITYNTVGVDTLTLIATSVSGSDTVSMIVTVTGLPQIAITGRSDVAVGDSATFTAVFLSGVDTATTYTWHSTLLDTTIHSSSPILSLVYSTSGIDTLTVTVTTLLGSTTYTLIVAVNNCNINTFPWSEGFENGLPACWRTHYEGTFFSWHTESSSDYSHFAHSGSRCAISQISRNTPDWLIMPAIEVPATGGLDFSFWVNFASNSSDVELTVLVSTTGRTSLAAFTDTILHESNHTYYPNLGYANTYVMRTLSLAPYAGQTIWLAFVNGNTGGNLFIDDISIDISGLPTVSLTGPSTVRSCDSAVFQATLLSGDTAGLTYTWHSIKVARGTASANITGDRMTIDYYEGGNDQLYVIVTNAVGSDTAYFTCVVTDCEPVSQFPYVVALTSYDNLHCWDIYDFTGDDGSHQWMIPYGGTCISSRNGWPNDDADAWLVTQELAIPDNDSISYTFSWHILCDHSRYQVLASTAGRATVDAFTDTLFFESRDTSSWTTRSILLDAYRGQRLYLAFRNLGWVNSPVPNYSDIGHILIDTVRVTATAIADTTPVIPPDTVWRTVSVTANEDGVCATFGSGRYLDSSSVEIGYTMVDTATVGGHWQFLGWSDGETGNPRNILVTSDTAVVALFQWISDSTTQAITQLNIQAITIYPNPASSDVTVRVSQPSVLTLLDLQGRVVIPPTSINSYLSPFTLHLSPYPRGTYFLRLVTNDGIVIKKLMLQ